MADNNLLAYNISPFLGDLLTAITQRNIPLIQKLIEEGVDVNTTACPVPPLIYAIQGLCLEDLTGSDPLSDYALRVQPVSEVVKFLLSLDGTDVNVCGADGKTPLIAAVEDSCCAGTVQTLLERGADVNKRETWTQRTALHYAVQGEWMQLIPLLVAKGADVDASDSNGCTPLYVAVTNPDIPSHIIQLLIDHGASVKVTDSTNNRSLLHQAVESVYGSENVFNALRVIDILMQSGAPFLYDGFGLNPIHTCFKWNAYACMAEMIRHGADALSLLTEFGEDATLCEVLLKRAHGLATVRNRVVWPEFRRLFAIIKEDGYCLHNDSWLANRKADNNNTDYTQLLRYVLQLREESMSLKSIACCRVRYYLKLSSCGHSILPLIEKLEIPCTLTDTLSMRAYAPGNTSSPSC